MRPSKPILFGLITILLIAVLPNCQVLAEHATNTSAARKKANLPNSQSATGEITGRVSFEGTRPKRHLVSMAQDPVCARAHQNPVYLEDYEVEPDGSLPNAFIYVKSGLNGRSFPSAKKPVNLLQVGCMFRPHVFGVMGGQPIEITSKDPTMHNVHFVPRINRVWNQSMPPGAPPLRVRFSKPEIMIPITCNNHPWMYAYVGVMANPFYAVTGSDGKFTIKGLPPGEYTLSAWTAVFGTRDQRVVVKSNKSTAISFVFSSQ